MRGFRLALFSALLLGCGSGSTAPDSGGAAGLYALHSVNGKTVPYRLLGSSEQAVDISDRTLLLVADGTFLDQVTLRFTEGGASRKVVVTHDGRFDFSSPDLTLDDDDGWGAWGRLIGGVLTVHDGGMIFELTR